MNIYTIDIPLILGPWIIISLIKIKSDTIIAWVKLDNNDNININKSYWVLKIKSVNNNEINQILLLQKYKIQNIVQFPDDHLYGNTELFTWYAMKKYDYVLNKIFIRQNGNKLNLLIKNGIHFLYSLHSINHIYSDFKFDNIFYDSELNTFIFADYDSIEPISNISLRDYHNDYTYYYYSKGGELEYPYKSYKFDLIAFGYIIAKLFSKNDYNKIYTWEFENECEKYRIIKSVTDKQIEKLHILRNSELKNIYNESSNPKLHAYFNLVNEYDWYEKIPKDNTFYEKLINVFN